MPFTLSPKPYIPKPDILIRPEPLELTLNTRPWIFLPAPHPRYLGHSGVKSLLAVPISFVSEHIETLEEIDMEYRELAEESGIKHWGRVPALNTNKAFIDDLADAVIEALPYVGCLAGPTDSLVPMGEAAYALSNNCIICSM